MPEAVDKRAEVSRRERLTGGGLLGPDRDNLAVILSLSAFVEDSLAGAPAEVVERRLSSLRDATDAAIDLGALPDLVRPTFDHLVERVQAVSTFASSVGSMSQTKEALLPAATSGGVSETEERSLAERLWGAMSARAAK